MADATPTVLVADDQPDVIAALRLLLRAAGFDTHGAASVDDVRAHMAARDFDAVLMDLNYARDTTSGAEGLDLIADLHASRPHVPLIAMTGWANVETAVEAMRRARLHPEAVEQQALVQVLRAEIDHARSSQPAREWREAQAIHRALPVSSLQATVRAFVSDDVSPQEAVARINRALCRQGAHGRFVTLFVAFWLPAIGCCSSPTAWSKPVRRHSPVGGPAARRRRHRTGPVDRGMRPVRPRTAASHERTLQPQAPAPHVTTAGKMPRIGRQDVA